MKTRFSVNPIMLRDIRRLVRSRFVTVALAVVPALMFAVSMHAFSVAAGKSPVSGLDVGSGFGTAPFFAATGVMMFGVSAIGLFVAVKTAVESGRGQELEFTTGLTPLQIVSGKISATALLTAVFLATSMPFLAFAYLLRGVSLASVFVAPFAMFVYSLVLTSVMLTLAYNVRWHVAVRIIAVIAVFGMNFFSNIVAAAVFSFSGIGSPASGASPSGRNAAVLAVAAAVVLLMRAFAASSIAPRHTDGDRPLRITLFTLMALSSPALLLSGPSAAAGTVWSSGWLSAAMFMLVCCALSPRQTPRGALCDAPASRLRRAVSFPFTTGASSGVLFSAAVAAAGLGGLWLSCSRGIVPEDAATAVTALVAESALVFVTAGILLRRLKARPGAYKAVLIAVAAYMFAVTLMHVSSGDREPSAETLAMMPLSLPAIFDGKAWHPDFCWFAAMMSGILALSDAAAEFRKYRRRK